MKDDNAERLRASRVWLTATPAISTRSRPGRAHANRADYPFAADVASNVPVYDGLEARSAAASPEMRKELMAEWVDALTGGPGIIVIRGAFPTCRDRQGQRALLGDHRGRARGQCRRRRSFRQAGRQ